MDSNYRYCLGIGLILLDIVLTGCLALMIQFADTPLPVIISFGVIVIIIGLVGLITCLTSSYDIN